MSLLLGHKIKYKNYLDYLKKFFSKKHPNNPIYFINFLILACPKKYIIKNISRIAFRGLARVLIPNYSRGKTSE
jgi:hypothetical protein